MICCFHTAMCQDLSYCNDKANGYHRDPFSCTQYYICYDREVIALESWDKGIYSISQQ